MEQSWRSFGSAIASLTPRECEVLEHVVVGQLNKQIAGDLGTGEHTIEIHRVLDDEPQFCKALARLLKTSGFDAVTFTHGEEGMSNQWSVISKQRTVP